MNVNHDSLFLVLCHLLLAFVALFWSRNMYRHEMFLSEHVFGLFAMYQMVAIGYAILN